MGFYVKLQEQLIKHEGIKLMPYRCTAGKLTIGIGRNLDDCGISRGEAQHMFSNDIAVCIGHLISIFPDYEIFPEPLKIALADMRFNLGRSGFLKFKKMIRAIKKGDYKKAATEAMDSKWFSQVGRRGPTVCNQIAKCEDE